MGKRIRKFAKKLLFTCVLIFAVTIVAGMQQVVDASNAAGAVGEGVPSYNTSAGIVQVVILYQDENTNYHIIQSGSGVLLDENTVITSRQMIVLSESNKAEAGAYLSELLGQTISFVPTEDGSVQVAAYQVAVVIEADIYNMATSTFSSADWDVATLTLSSPMSREYAVLGDSDQIEQGKKVSVLGFPDSPCTNPQSFQTGDLVITEGICSDRAGGNINHTAAMQRGSTGGALVDEYGRVIGIATYNGNEAGIYSALPINQVKAYLDRDGVAYKEDVSVYDAEAEPEETTAVATETDADNVHTTIKTDLYRTIQEAKLIYEEGNNGVYTEDSFRDLQVEYDVAISIYENEFAEQTAIDEETERLREKIDGLQKVKKVNVTFVVMIAALSVIVIGIIVVVTILLVKKNKKKKIQMKEQQKIKTFDGNTGRQTAGASSASQNSVSAIKSLNNSGLPSSQLYAQFDAKASMKKNSMAVDNDMNASTSVLQPNEETNVLNAFVQAPINALLRRSSSGENIPISSESFVLGKNNEGVDYRIDDNTNISRMHARITRQNDDYYIEDLNSTNNTYINGARIMPGSKQLLKVNDVIYLADEEFVFIKNV